VRCSTVSSAAEPQRTNLLSLVAPDRSRRRASARRSEASSLRGAAETWRRTVNEPGGDLAGRHAPLHEGHDLRLTRCETDPRPVYVRRRRCHGDRMPRWVQVPEGSGNEVVIVPQHGRRWSARRPCHRVVSRCRPGRDGVQAASLRSHTVYRALSLSERTSFRSSSVIVGGGVQPPHGRGHRASAAPPRHGGGR
jgi:hypothetical protein